MPKPRARNSVLSGREAASRAQHSTEFSARSGVLRCGRDTGQMKLPSPPFLLVTDRHQARRPLADVVRAALTAGCRWVSVREKDLSEDEQITLARTLLPMVRRSGACLTLHGEA